MVAPDLSIFGKNKGFGEYQRANDEFEQRKALIQAQILGQQAAVLKASQVDADKLGEQAFLKAAQGMPLSPQETAALKYIDAKSPTSSFNPVTGNLEVKPSLLDRAGLNNTQINQPPAAGKSPAGRTVPDSFDAPPVVNGTPNAGVVDLFTSDGAPVNDAPEYVSEWDIAFQKELDAAAGNPKLQQTIKSDYAKSKISMTEAEAKAAGFADRMMQSNQIVEKTTPAALNLKEKQLNKIPMLGNFIVSGDYRSFSQAQRDFINAQLRRESGAVISPAEFDNAERQYFPTPGDDENTLAQKAANRNAAVMAMQRSAGAAYKPMPQPKAPQKKAGVSTDADIAQSLMNAKKAIASGKNPNAVRQKLIDAGIDPAKAGL